jgi:hypothetical protein
MLSSRAAFAFSDPLAYPDPVDLGGGAGRWFTGSSADGYGCDVCHSGGAPAEVQVVGLPLKGFEAGQDYEVTLTWPQVKNVALIAEFTGEQRQGAGTLSLPRLDTLKPDDLCAIEEGGEPVSEIQMAENQRMLLSLVDCGAKRVRFQWTAPIDSADPVWFNVGFVASNVDATPLGDGVTLVKQPLPPLRRALGTDTIATGCTTGPLAPEGSPGTMISWAWAGLLWLRRSHARRSKS